MNALELWNELEAERIQDLVDLVDSDGHNGLDNFTRRVRNRLKDGDSYEAATKIFDEELENA